MPVLHVQRKNRFFQVQLNRLNDAGLKKVMKKRLKKVLKGSYSIIHKNRYVTKRMHMGLAVMYLLYR